MAANDCFEIEVTNWDKHNSNNKKGHSYFLVEKRFFDDAKIMSLSGLQRLLFLCILSVCADSGSRNIVVHPSLLARRAGVQPAWVGRMMYALEELQLLKIVKSPSNIKEKKIKEDKGREKKAREISETPKSEEAAQAPAAVAAAPIGRDLIAHYCEVYKTRYKANPVIRPQDAKAMKNFGESVGKEKAQTLIAAYLRMNHSWFITKAHDIQTFLTNLNQVQNFVNTGQVVTLADARNAEGADSLKNQIARLSGESA